MLNTNTVSLDDYEIVQPIGSGAYGSVFKVKYKKTDEIYAAKVLTAEIDEDDPSSLKEFKSEVSIISRISHPSILQFVGMSMTNFEKRNQPVLITNFLPNGSLKSILKQVEEGNYVEQWNYTKKMINIYGIAAAMEFLHSNQILHRDLKPDNILMNELFYPIIADFGLSKDTRMISSSSKSEVGTPGYMAPEIFKDGICSKESDVYAFAFIVYEIITGRNPFENLPKNLVQYVNAICNGDRPDTSFLKEPFKSLITKCWSDDPTNRPSFKDIVHDLRNNPRYRGRKIDNNVYNDYIKYISNSHQDFVSLIDPKYKKVIDIVFLIDGIKSNTHFLESIRNKFISIYEYCKSKHSKTYFQFGVVVYYDLIVSQNSQTESRYYSKFINLTDSFEDIQEFLDNIQLKGVKTFSEGYYYSNDLASGYNAVLDRIRWNKNSERVVIHLCDSPAHGKYFTIDPEFQYMIKIPQFNQNYTLLENKKIYDMIQEKRNNWLALNIIRLAKEGIQLYCLNCREINLYCFNKIIDKYNRFNGKKFLVKNIFESNQSKFENLNEQLEQFVYKVVDSFYNESIANALESDCKSQFENDYKTIVSPKYTYLKEIKQLENRNEQLEKEISDAKSLLHDRFESISYDQNNSISDMIKQISVEKPDYHDDDSIANDQIQELKEKVQKIEVEKSDLTEKYYDQIAKLQNENKLMKNQVSTLSEKIKDYQSANKKLQEKVDAIKDMEYMYKNNVVKLSNKYKVLKQMNHNNYILIEKMKRQLINEGEIKNDDQKLGGIDLIKKAFENKNEIIKNLKEELRKNEYI